MSFGLFCVGVVMIALGLGMIVTFFIGKARRGMGQTAKLVSIVTSAALLLSASAGTYHLLCYHPTDRILPFVVSSETVTVTEVPAGRFYDGPSTDTAIVFYPGAMVDSDCYAPLMHILSRDCADCFLLDLPLDLSILDTSAPDKVLAEYDYEHWYIAGHSLGGVSASEYAVSNPGKADGVILLASYPITAMQDDLRLLSIRGSADKVLVADEYENSRSCFPPDTTEIVIEGGNHAGFGDYGAQRGDGKADLTPKEQQAETVAAITDFLDQ